MIPFFALAGLAGFLAPNLQGCRPIRCRGLAAAPQAGARPRGRARARAPRRRRPLATPAGAEDVRKLIEVDVFAIEIGHGLLSLADAKSGGDLLARVTGVRKQLAREKGIVVPPISVRDNLELEANVLPLPAAGQGRRPRPADDRPLARDERRGQQGRACAACRPASRSSTSTRPGSTRREKKIAGTERLHGRGPAVGPHHPPLRDPQGQRPPAARAPGGPVAASTTSRRAIPRWSPSSLPDLVNLGIIQRVLQNLLRENIAILNLPLILEAIADFASLSKNPDDLSELVRRRLGLYFVPEYECRAGRRQGGHARPPLRAVAGGQDPPHRRPMSAWRWIRRRAATCWRSWASAAPPTRRSRACPPSWSSRPRSAWRCAASSSPPSPAWRCSPSRSCRPRTEIENAGIVPLPAHLARAETALKAAA